MPLSSTCQWNPGLEFVSVVGPDFLDPEREPPDHVVDEVDGIRLVMSIVDLQGADTGRVVDSRELEAADLLAILSHE